MGGQKHVPLTPAFLQSSQPTAIRRPLFRPSACILAFALPARPAPWPGVTRAGPAGARPRIPVPPSRSEPLLPALVGRSTGAPGSPRARRACGRSLPLPLSSLGIGGPPAAAAGVLLASARLALSLLAVRRFCPPGAPESPRCPGRLGGLVAWVRACRGRSSLRAVSSGSAAPQPPEPGSPTLFRPRRPSASHHWGPPRPSPLPPVFASSRCPSSPALCN